MTWSISTESAPALTKREFILEYVLRRAATSSSSLSGVEASKEAAAAWDVIERIAPGEKESDK